MKRILLNFVNRLIIPLGVYLSLLCVLKYRYNLCNVKNNQSQLEYYTRFVDIASFAAFLVIVLIILSRLVTYQFYYSEYAMNFSILSIAIISAIASSFSYFYGSCDLCKDQFGYSFTN